jgi:hypothetical protein
MHTTSLVCSSPIRNPFFAASNTTVIGRTFSATGPIADPSNLVHSGMYILR